MPDELFKKIEVTSTAEIIAERFDDALDLMHRNALVYGGAIRDIVAGLPILGDLDIAAAGVIYSHTVSFFRMSSKWTEMRQGPAPTSPLSAGLIQRTTRTTARPKKKYPLPKLAVTTSPKLAVAKKQTNPYHTKSVSAVTTFETFDNAKVQIMLASSTDPTKGSVQSTFEIVKNVDIRCCGLALDSNGNVYEIVNGAYQDCIDRVLRINKVDDNLELEYLKDRIKKLKARGWTSKINISSIEARLKKKEQERKKARAERKKRQTKSQPYNQWLTVEKLGKDQFSRVILHREMVSKIGPFARVDSLVKNAGNIRGVGIHRSEPLRDGTWQVTVASAMGASSLCKELWKQIKIALSDEPTIKTKNSGIKAKSKGGWVEQGKLKSSIPAAYKVCTSNYKHKTREEGGEIHEGYTEVAENTPEDAPEMQYATVGVDINNAGEFANYGSADYFISDGETIMPADDMDDMSDVTHPEPADDMPDVTHSEETMPHPEPSVGDEHTHHLEAVIRGKSVHINTTNRDITPGENIIIDVSKVAEELLPEVLGELRNISDDLTFETAGRNTILASPGTKKKVRGGIIIPDDAPESRISDGLLRTVEKSKRLTRKKRR